MCPQDVNGRWVISTGETNYGYWSGTTWIEPVYAAQYIDLHRDEMVREASAKGFKA
jgi:hypothetical protein